MDRVLREFRVNDFITLKLERELSDGVENDNSRTEGTYKVRIYLNGKPFRQCKYLLLINPHLQEKQSEIRSIDEAKKYLQKDLEREVTPQMLGITPEEEFWAHCSNLQAWVEHEYDTRLLDSRLAFPLLQRLADLGDPIAKKIYYEEVFDRFLHGTKEVKEVIMDGAYLDDITRDQSVSLIEDPKDLDTILRLEEELGREFYLYPFGYDFMFELKDGKISGIFLYGFHQESQIPACIQEFANLEDLSINGSENKRIRELPEWIGTLSNLQSLWVDLPYLETIPETLGDLQNLEHLGLIGKSLRTLPHSIGELKSLKKFYLRGSLTGGLSESFGELKSLTKLDIKDSQISRFPESFGHLRSLKKLLIENCVNLTSLPDSFGNLESLETLEILNSGLERLPESFGNLKCKEISIVGSQLKKLPKSIGNLIATSLSFSSNKLEELPTSIGNLKNVEKLSFSLNNLEQVPNSIGKLGKLKYLYLSYNSLNSLPDTIENLKKLETLHLDNNKFESFPLIVIKMKNLKRLDLNNYDREELPKYAKGKVINKNKFRSIPDEIKYMVSLEELSLRNTELTELPLTIGNLENLEYIFIQGSGITKAYSKQFEEEIGKKNIINFF